MADINIDGNGTPTEELMDFLRGKFQASLVTALNEVGAEMQATLAKHVETDVYRPYSPRLYERRGEGGLLGQARRATVYNGGNRVAIEYKPDGSHPTVSGWHKVDNDALIGRIESHSPEYNWLPKRGNIPNRPFWQNFVSEMVDEGRAEFALASSLRGQGLDVIEDGDVSSEGSDGSY